MFPPIKVMDSPQEPSGGEFNNRMMSILTKDRSLDDWLLEDSGHHSVLSEGRSKAS